MASRTVPILEEFHTKISGMNGYIEKLNQLMENLWTPSGDESEEKKKKLNAAVQYFNRIQGKLREYELQLGEFDNETRLYMVSELDLLIQELECKRNEFMDELRCGSWSVNQPYDRVPNYWDNVKSILLESKLLKVEMEEFQAMVELRRDVNESNESNNRGGSKSLILNCRGIKQ